MTDDDAFRVAERVLVSGGWVPTAAERSLGAAVLAVGADPPPAWTPAGAVARIDALTAAAAGVAAASPMRDLVAVVRAASAAVDPGRPETWGALVAASSVVAAAVSGDIDY